VTEGVAQGVRLLAGRYQVGELIGRGGMADVYSGIDSRLGRRVAIKLLRPALAADPTFRARFRREAQDAAKMAHPTIVRIFDAGEETHLEPDGSETQLPFIIMEFVDGTLLKKRIESGPIATTDAVAIVGQVLTALEYSHRAGLVHRDIKPGNIMITTTGQVKVMDFGIARAITDTSSTIAETSTIVGTAQYFSPEQARGEAVDARTDLYSTGIVLFELLTGRAPFVGDNPVAVAYQHVNQQAVAPSAINPHVPPALDAVVLRAIAKDRFDRYQSATEFRKEIQAAAAGAPAPRKTTPAPDFNATLFGVNPTATAGSEATLRQLSADQQDRAPRSQSRPPVAWIWGGIAIMAVIIIGVMYWTLHLTATPGITNNAAVDVPVVSGMTWDESSVLLLDDRLKPVQQTEESDTVAAGSVIRTDPAAGIGVAPGETIIVYVSTGAPQVTVPNVTGLSKKKAAEALTDAGFTVGDGSTDHSANIKKDVVLESSPTGGKKADRGSAVDLVYSDGKVDVPNVNGDDIGDATEELQSSKYGLTVQQQPDFGCSGGSVTGQSLENEQDQGSTVILYYCASGD